MTMRDVCPASHWAMRGTLPCAIRLTDVYPGEAQRRCCQAAVYCAGAAFTIAIGPLAATCSRRDMAFFKAMSAALSLGLTTDRGRRALRRAAQGGRGEAGVTLGVPLEMSMSCMDPRGGLHCGQCSKGRERARLFDEAGVLTLRAARAVAEIDPAFTAASR
jgi:7-cyano-7-deazaguanine synthase in queuosine biosynthesis